MSNVAEANQLEAFQQLTGCNQQTARALLEAANWNLEMASTLYFDNPPESMNASEPVATSATPFQPTAQNVSSATTKAPPKRTGGIRTFSDFSRDESDEEEDDDSHNTYYAGGEKSGIQVKAPKADDVANKISESATKYGAKPHEIQKSSAFEGTGYRLGAQLDTPSSVVKKQPQEVNKVLTLYKNGFTVDNGPLRTFDQPANIKFLDDVYRGVIPEELEKDIGGAVLNLSFVDNKNQDYVPPKPTFQPFTSAGRTLSETSSIRATASAQPSTTSTTKSLQVDESKPITTLQIRLHDGARLVAKFNTDHTVQDLINFIHMAKPLGGRTFQLMQPPRQPITADSNKTLSEAGLLNAVVIQHLN